MADRRLKLSGLESETPVVLVPKKAKNLHILLKMTHPGLFQRPTLASFKPGDPVTTHAPLLFEIDPAAVVTGHLIM